MFFIESCKFSGYDFNFIVCITDSYATVVTQPLVRRILNLHAVIGTRRNHYLMNLWKYFLLLPTHTIRQTNSWGNFVTALVYLGCFINAHTRLLCRGLRWGLDGRVGVWGLHEWPPWLSCLAWSPTLATNTETGIPAVTQHWANKGRHSIDIEKYSWRISRDESDPFCLISAWYAGGNTN